MRREREIYINRGRDRQHMSERISPAPDPIHDLDLDHDLAPTRPRAQSSRLRRALFLILALLASWRFIFATPAPAADAPPRYLKPYSPVLKPASEEGEK